jgi:cell division protein FtsW
MKTLAKLLTRGPDRGPVDIVLAALAVALLGFGVVMVYSSSVIEATVVFHDPQYFLSARASTRWAAC